MTNPLNKKLAAGLTGAAILTVMVVVLATLALYNRFAPDAVVKVVEGNAPKI